jgi:hypothetical protein
MEGKKDEEKGREKRRKPRQRRGIRHLLTPGCVRGRPAPWSNQCASFLRLPSLPHMERCNSRGQQVVSHRAMRNSIGVRAQKVGRSGALWLTNSRCLQPFFTSY